MTSTNTPAQHPNTAATAQKITATFLFGTRATQLQTLLHLTKQEVPA